MYIVAWLLVALPSNAEGRVAPVQLDRFKTRAECVTVVERARAKHGDSIAPLACVPESKEPKK